MLGRILVQIGCQMGAKIETTSASERTAIRAAACASSTCAPRREGWRVRMPARAAQWRVRRRRALSGWAAREGHPPRRPRRMARSAATA